MQLCEAIARVTTTVRRVFQNMAISLGTVYVWMRVCVHVCTETEQLHCFSPPPTIVPLHSRTVMEWND